MAQNSNAKIIKSLIIECLDSGGTKSMKEIVEYVINTANRPFTSGMISGAMNDLISTNKEYVRVNRGLYARADAKPERNLENEKLLEILKTAIIDAEKTRRMDITLLTPESLIDLQQRIEYVVKSLRDIAKTLESPQQDVVGDEIKSLLDGDGKVTGWPRKPANKQAVCEYVATHFKLGQVYNERDVNKIIESAHTFGDLFLLRREMVSRGLLARKTDGSQYWRVK